jgi:hypothetical protein
MEYTEEQIRNMSRGKKRELAKAPDTPGEVLEILSKDEDDVRWRVAWNTNTPVKVLEDLSTDEDWSIRSAVVRNPNTPVGALETLAKDENGNVRSGVATHPNSTEQVLVRLFEYERTRKTPDRSILEEIIDNANCPDWLKATIQTVLEGM